MLIFDLVTGKLRSMTDDEADRHAYNEGWWTGWLLATLSAILSVLIYRATQ